jgi:hypothetical protein
MFSVVGCPRFSFHGVVSHSRLCALALTSVFVPGWWPREALATPVDGVPRAAKPSPEVQPLPQASPALPAEKSYRDVLATSYVVAPALALAAGHTMAEMETSDSGAVLGAAALFLAPAIVHMAHGKGVHGPLAFLGMTAITTVGTLLGGMVGHGIAASGCDPEEDSEGCDFAGINGFVLGALIGGVGGYTGFAIYDVSENGAVPLEEPRGDRASLQLWLSPLPAARRERVEPAPAFGGVQIGATLAM